jgi:hypothetical protein
LLRPLESGFAKVGVDLDAPACPPGVLCDRTQSTKPEMQAHEVRGMRAVL